MRLTLSFVNREREKPTQIEFDCVLYAIDPRTPAVARAEAGGCGANRRTICRAIATLAEEIALPATEGSSRFDERSGASVR